MCLFMVFILFSFAYSFFKCPTVVSLISAILYLPLSFSYAAAVDFHNYHAFGSYWNIEVAESPDGWDINLEESCNYASNLEIQTMEAFVGEWSLATTDCQKYLAGG